MTYAYETSWNHHPSSHLMEHTWEEAMMWPRNSCQRDTERETKEKGHTSSEMEMENMATNRQQWRSFVDGLCSRRTDIHK